METKTFSGGFLYNPKTKSVFLHKRDDKTPVNPNHLAFFGGLNENGETPAEGFQRELEEETGLKVDLNEIHYLDDYFNKEQGTHRHVFYVISDTKKEDLTLGEGAGFDRFSLDTVFQENITEKTERDLKTFLKKIQEK